MTRAFRGGAMVLPLGGLLGWLACSSPAELGVEVDDGGGRRFDASLDASAADATDAGDEYDGAPRDRIGSIFAISDNTTVADGGTKDSYRAGAFFRRITTPDTTTTTRTVGPCVVEKIGDGERAGEEVASAGTVHIEGGNKALALVPDVDLSYTPQTGSQPLWTGGDKLTARSTGKDVPAFTVMLTAPSKVVLTEPALATRAVTVKRSTGFSAIFAGPSSGLVVLYFDAAEGQNAHTATCTFDPKAGVGTVPAEAFTDFPAGEGTFNFYVKETAKAFPSNWEIRFTTSRAMVNPAGLSLAGNATFE